MTGRAASPSRRRGRSRSRGREPDVRRRRARFRRSVDDRAREVRAARSVRRRRPPPASDCRRCSTPRCRTTSSRCSPATSTDRRVIFGSDPIPPLRCPLAAMPGWAWAPVDQYTQDGEPFAGVSRGVHASHGRCLRAAGSCGAAAFEFEFSVGTRSDDGGFVRRTKGPGTATSRSSPTTSSRSTSSRRWRRRASDLQQFHPEYADGQFEMSIAPREPVAAADAAMVVRQTVRAVARRHGLVASFAPQVATTPATALTSTSACGTAARTSWRVARARPACSDRAESFVAGMLARATGDRAVTAPSA